MSDENRYGIIPRNVYLNSILLRIRNAASPMLQVIDKDDNNKEGNGCDIGIWKV